MQAVSARRLCAGLATAGLIGAGAIAFTGSAAAEQARGTDDKAKVKIKLDGQDLFFEGPDTVAQGQKLQIVNKTNPQRVGPHTFSLVKKGKKPTKRIIRTHQVGPPPDFPVGKPKVDSGDKGWDQTYTKHRNGDSWFTQRQGARHTREVTAEVGKTIRYFCVVHPFMKGKFDVTE